MRPDCGVNKIEVPTGNNVKLAVVQNLIWNFDTAKVVRVVPSNLECFNFASSSRSWPEAFCVVNRHGQVEHYRRGTLLKHDPRPSCWEVKSLSVMVRAGADCRFWLGMSQSFQIHGMCLGGTCRFTRTVPLILVLMEGERWSEALIIYGIHEYVGLSVNYRANLCQCANFKL
jgi:hypothetical protein